MNSSSIELHQNVLNDKTISIAWDIIKKEADKATNNQATRPPLYKVEDRVHFIFSERPFDVEDLRCIAGGYVYLLVDAQDIMCKLIADENSLTKIIYGKPSISDSLS